MSEATSEATREATSEATSDERSDEGSDERSDEGSDERRLEQSDGVKRQQNNSYITNNLLLVASLLVFARNYLLRPTLEGEGWIKTSLHCHSAITKHTCCSSLRSLPRSSWLC